jgi:hypothetical protein
MSASREKVPLGVMVWSVLSLAHSRVATVALYIANRKSIIVRRVSSVSTLN